ncbi:MAG: ImmA/IrrE family metallo-endopeptidase [Actinomycetota bacterium]|nr:ImmA/IrrE family metallo-endopeptidase [Actinomycetota bacterium]
MRKNALAEAIGKTPTAVAAYESGAKRPAPATVATLALALGVGPEFFLAGPSDYASLAGLPHFRSLRSTTQVARDQAYAYGRLAVAVAAALERHVELPAVDLPQVPVALEDNADGPEWAAGEVRRKWGLVTGPVGHLVRIAEHHGVLVVFGPQQTTDVDAHSFDNAHRPVVILNPLKQDYYRQRFDVAHEFGHLVMHVDAEPGGKVVEEQAHRFAAELLMPRDELVEVLPRRADWRELATLKERWGVSMQALLFRARRLGIMSDSTYRNAMTTLSARGWRRREPGPLPVLEQPSLLPRAVQILADHGVDAPALAAEARVPVPLFELITARTPPDLGGVPSVGASEGGGRPRLSLLQTPARGRS